MSVMNHLAKRFGYEIPFAVNQTLIALWTNDLFRPQVNKTTKTKLGWCFVITLPPGISYDEFSRRENYFADATGCSTSLEHNGKAVILEVYTTKLEKLYNYEWEPQEYEKMYLPLPLGMGISGLQVVDLAEAPHLFISGPTGGGKSMLMRSLATSLQISRNETMFMVVVDYGEVDYLWLENRALLVTEIDTAYEVFQKLNKEMDKRKKLLVKNRVEKVTQLKEKIPFIVLLIDEFAEINEDKDSVKLVNRLLRVGRKTGIHVIAATQRFSHTTVKGAGDIKINFPARLSFRCDATNSRMILGEDCDAAAKLPKVKGRCIYRDSENPIEIQTFLIPPKQAEKLIQQVPEKEGFVIEQSRNLLPPR